MNRIKTIKTNNIRLRQYRYISTECIQFSLYSKLTLVDCKRLNLHEYTQIGIIDAIMENLL